MRRRASSLHALLVPAPPPAGVNAGIGRPSICGLTALCKEPTERSARACRLYPWVTANWPGMLPGEVRIQKSGIFRSKAIIAPGRTIFKYVTVSDQNGGRPGLAATGG